jgi:hypothetical protein
LPRSPARTLVLTRIPPVGFEVALVFAVSGVAMTGSMVFMVGR